MFSLNPSPRLLQLLAGICAVLCLGISSAYAAAGKIQFVAGEAKIVNDKQAERAATKGDILNQGDSIVTGPAGSVQVLLEDGGLLAVRPNTQMKIDAYAYSGKADDPNNKSFFSLGKGTFRSITGAIGQNNKQAYRVTTPTATMGIRGTDHEPAVILPPPPGLPPPPPGGQPLPQPGTYDRVNSGQTFMQNQFGLIVIGVNQVGFAPIGGAPSVLPNTPGFYSSTPKPGAAKQSAKTTTTTTSSNSTADGSSDSSTSSTADSGSTSASTGGDSGSFGSTGDSSTSYSAPSQDTNTVTTVTSSPTLASAAGVSATRMAPIGSGLVGTYIDASPMVGPSSGSIFLTAASPSQEILLGAQNEVLRIFDGLTPPTFEFLSNSSSLTDQGSITFSDGGRVDWGRWLPGFSVIDGGIAASTVGDFQYIFSQNITPTASIPLTGTALYSYVGGPAPADLNGVTGSILASTSLNVDFAQQFVTFNVGTLINGVTLTGSASGSIAAFIDPNSAIISPPTAAALVKANGFFVGPTAAGAITSFTILDNQSTNGATGTAVFAR